MAVIPQGVSHLVETIVSYLYVVLTILIIVKLVQLVMSIGGTFKGKFGGGNSGNDDNKKGRSKEESGNGGNWDDGGKPKKPKSSYTYLDPSRLGTVKFKVEDVEGRPIRNAQIIVAPNRQKRKFSEPPITNNVVQPPPE